MYAMRQMIISCSVSWKASWMDATLRLADLGSRLPSALEGIVSASVIGMVNIHRKIAS